MIMKCNYIEKLRHVIKELYTQLSHCFYVYMNLSAVSLKLLGGKLAPKPVYFVLRKELLNLREMAPWTKGLHRRMNHFIR